MIRQILFSELENYGDKGIDTLPVLWTGRTKWTKNIPILLETDTSVSCTTLFRPVVLKVHIPTFSYFIESSFLPSGVLYLRRPLTSHTHIPYVLDRVCPLIVLLRIQT